MSIFWALLKYFWQIAQPPFEKLASMPMHTIEPHARYC